MAEVYHTTDAGETTQLFIQFVMMQHQQTLFALGRHPSPPPQAPPANHALAKAFIDQLGMIALKTHGNLNADEKRVLETALSELRMKYVEVTEAAQ
jgi:ABC-type Fe3+ transport system substrate-binding protein